uniref:Uncharacterized protein n=1 Tax=Anguilla anguilla TaxID=7936 RepID=A0A0E9R0D1_ANGAN
MKSCHSWQTSSTHNFKKGLWSLNTKPL